MITLQRLNSLSHDELGAAIRERCAEYGTVLRVIVLKDDKWHGFALAGVEMSTQAESAEILQRLGDHRLDTMVIIKVEQT